MCSKIKCYTLLKPKLPHSVIKQQHIFKEKNTIRFCVTVLDFELLYYIRKGLVYFCFYFLIYCHETLRYVHPVGEVGFLSVTYLSIIYFIKRHSYLSVCIISLTWSKWHCLCPIISFIIYLFWLFLFYSDFLNYHSNFWLQAVSIMLENFLIGCL